MKKDEQASSSNEEKSDAPSLHAKSIPLQNVPVFECIVYLQTSESGVRARVANLAGLECTADSEMSALRKLVTEFKRTVGELTTQKQPIPWIDPPAPAEPGELKRFVPVHL
ncbi:MAG: hypothetical protein NXI22_17615 [bacterium]|nr:hypothetical protein [bacterium]